MEKLILKIQRLLLVSRIVVLFKSVFVHFFIADPFNIEACQWGINFWVESHTKEGESPVFFPAVRALFLFVSAVRVGLFGSIA
jgi:hypothetical protein